MNKKLISLGGKMYDVETGLPVETSTPNTTQPTLSKLKSSNTLNREFVNKPNLTQKPAQSIINPRIRQIKRRDINNFIPQGQYKNSNISHFKKAEFNTSNKPVILNEVKKADITVTPAQNAAFIKRMENAKKVEKFKSDIIKDIARERRIRQQKLTAQAMRIQRINNLENKEAPQAKNIVSSSLTNQMIKNNVIAESIAKAPTSKEISQAYKKPKQSFNFKKFMSFAAGSLGIIMLGGYLTYINMPNITMRIAANEAGINSSYPEYTPLGYTLSKPAKFDNGKVAMSYSNKNDKYDIYQQKNNYNSEELLNNVVKKAVGDNYTVNQENGLSIYIYEDNNNNRKAVWVNGGILYEINSTYNLTNDQIHSIAMSI